MVLEGMVNTQQLNMPLSGDTSAIEVVHGPFEVGMDSSEGFRRLWARPV
jgi:hypothetical protein